MSDLQRRSGSRLSRQQREARAYRLTLATAGLGIVGVVGLIVAIFTSVGAGWPIVALILAGVSGFWLRATLSGR